MATVDVVIPVLNEAQALPTCVEQLRGFLKDNLGHHKWRVLVADNGSTDSTLQVAQDLAKQHPGEVDVIHLDIRGRGRALKRAWLESAADIVSYMDVDLSTGLDAFPELIDCIARDGFDISFGSRLMKGAHTTRGFKRTFTSRMLNILIQLFMRTKFTDAQCGFKAASRQAAQVLMPAIVNNYWFWDSELLIVSELRGFRLKEIPVTWVEDTDTRVKVLRTGLEMLQGIARLRLGGIPEVVPPGERVA